MVSASTVEVPYNKYPALAKNTHCAGVASEELDDATPANNDGSLLVLFDPLDGSSNIDINMAVGTIFSVLPYERQGQPSENNDYLQSAHRCTAALVRASSDSLSY